MKTLIAMITAGTIITAAIGAVAGVALITPTPQVVKERLLGFNIYPTGIISLQWDLDNNNEEDLRVVYQFQMGKAGAYILRPFVYYQDLNFNGDYEDNERFRRASDKWRAYNEDGNT